MAKLLVEAGAEVNLQDKEGRWLGLGLGRGLWWVRRSTCRTRKVGGWGRA